MDSLMLAALVSAVVLGLVHLFAGRLRFITYVPRSWWLSFAGGASVAYVFVHLLPELRRVQQSVAAAAPGLETLAERHVYLVGLFGLAVYYGVESLALRSRDERRERTGHDTTGPGVFWVHITAFGLYNLLIGYLLVQGESTSPASLGAFAFAMALHFVVNDAGLRAHHQQRYDRAGRWLLSAAVVGGWAAGIAIRIHEAAAGVLLAFLAGGVILNVLKEEVPQERQSRFLPFAMGAASYAVALLVLLG